MPIYIDIDPAYVPTQFVGPNARVEVKVNKFMGIKSTDGSELTGEDKLIFYTEAIPMYASVDYIMLLGGEIMAKLPEAAVYNMGFAASTMVDDIVMIDESSYFPSKTTEQWRFYNRAKTEYAARHAVVTLIRGAIIGKATQASRKILADFSVDTSNLIQLPQSSRDWMRDLTNELTDWKKILWAGGMYDYNAPVPVSAVKGGSNIRDNTRGIGRGWEVGGMTLNRREATVRAGDTWTRPVAYADPRYYTSNWWYYPQQWNY